MIAVLWPQPNARSVHQPEPTAFGLPMGDFQPLGSPDPLDPLVVDLSSKPGAIAQRPYDSRSGRPDAPRRHGHAGRCVALSDAARAPHRHDARDMRLRSDLLNAGTRGLQVSLGGLLQDELVKRQIGDRLAKPVVPELKLLQPLYLFDLHPASFLAPAMVGHLAHTDLTDCIRHNLTPARPEHPPVATSRRSPHSDGKRDRRAQRAIDGAVIARQRRGQHAGEGDAAPCW
jgi:hypothetical protein